MCNPGETKAGLMRPAAVGMASLLDVAEKVSEQEVRSRRGRWL